MPHVTYTQALTLIPLWLHLSLSYCFQFKLHPLSLSLSLPLSLYPSLSLSLSLSLHTFILYLYFSIFYFIFIYISLIFLLLFVALATLLSFSQLISLSFPHGHPLLLFRLPKQSLKLLFNHYLTNKKISEFVSNFWFFWKIQGRCIRPKPDDRINKNWVTKNNIL